MLSGSSGLDSYFLENEKGYNVIMKNFSRIMSSENALH